MLKFERKTLELDVYGEVYTLKFPTVKEGQVLSERVKRIKEGQDDGSVMIDFLDSLGLPKEVCMGLEIDHLEQIVGALIPKKK